VGPPLASGADRCRRDLEATECQANIVRALPTGSNNDPTAIQSREGPSASASLSAQWRALQSKSREAPSQAVVMAGTAPHRLGVLEAARGISDGMHSVAVRFAGYWRSSDEG
jgi:hypothetical protein